MFYFTWAVVGASLSVSLLILIIGVPLLVLFLGSIRALAFIEGRMVEVLLGVRMPRRSNWQDPQTPWLKRIGAMFTDPRSWATLVYFLLMLPLGIAYFATAVTLLSTSLAFIAAPFGFFFANGDYGMTFGDVNVVTDAPWLLPLLSVVGVALLFATLHLARGIGKLHGLLAKHLLVCSAVV